MAEGETYAIEYRVRRKDGRYIWVQDHGKRVRAAEGNEFVLSTFYDLSGQSEARADESRLYGDIVRHSTDGVYVLEQGSYKLLYANDAMEAIFRSVGIQDYQGKACYCALRRRTQPCEDCFVYPPTNVGESREIYLDFLSRYYSVSAHSVEWRGRPATVIYLSDISAEKKSHFELEKTREKLAAAIDHAGLAYWEYDIKNSRAYLNTISTSEYTLDQIIENYPAGLYETGTIHPDSIPLYDSLVQAVKNGQPTARADIKTIGAKGNPLWKRVRFTTLFDEKNQPFWAVATAESIDDYKSLESRFTTVLDQNHIDTWMYDLPRHTIIQNHNTEEVYGIHGTEIPDVPESLIAGKQCHLEDVERFRDFYRRLHAGETQVSTTVRLWDIRARSYIWKRCTYTILPDRNGAPLYALGSAVEVTDQIEAKQKYEDAIRYRYRTLGENVLLAGHCNVTRNVILEVEDKTGLDVEHRFGMVREDFFRGIGSLISDASQQETFCKTFGNENMKNSFELGITQHDCVSTINLGGGIRWISTHVDTALQPETGELIGFLTVTDISAGKMQEQVLDAVIQFDYDFVAHLNLHTGDTVFYNSKSQMTLLQDYTYGIPYSYTDAIRHTADAYIAEEDKALYANNMSIENVTEQLAERDSYEFTYHLREENGEIRTKQTRFAMHDRTAGIVVFSRADVTDMLTQQEKQKVALSESLAI
ncbi:MAG: PAS domain-containing protein, partial [Oscillospiraceae bacterium]